MAVVARTCERVTKLEWSHRRKVTEKKSGVVVFCCGSGEDGRQSKQVPSLVGCSWILEKAETAELEDHWFYKQSGKIEKGKKSK